jgi:hypothetical protein
MNAKNILNSENFTDAPEDDTLHFETIDFADDKEAARADDHEARKASLLREIEARAYVDDRPVPKPTTRFYVAGKSVSTPGNLTAIIAQAKAGKSALVGAFIAALFVAGTKARNANFYEGDEPDTLGVTATAPGGTVVLHLDTEQSEYDHDRLVRTAKRRARIEKTPDWFRSHRLAGFNAPTLRLALETLVEKHGPNNINAIILDGVADFVDDVNAPGECNPFVAGLHALAIKCACPIVGVIHENPGAANTGSGKGRGHLGSQMERKSESNVCLKKDAEGITTIYADKMRGAPIPESTGPRFHWSDEHNMHVSTDSKAATRENIRCKELLELAEEAFGGAELLSYVELRDAITKARGCARRSSERHIRDMKTSGFLRNAGAGKMALSS